MRSNKFATFLCILISWCTFVLKINKLNMSCILNIETSTTVCSVAVSLNGNIIFNKEDFKGPSHASVLGVFVDEAVKYLRKESIQLDAVAVSCGPGSYTGLRIGVSEAKGLCYGLNIPLIAVETLKVMAHKVASSERYGDDVLLCPMIDARRMEVYASIYKTNLDKCRDIQADIVDDTTYQEFLSENEIVFFGNGAEKCKSVLTTDNALFIADVHPLASDMIALSEEAFKNKQFVDVAYFEPFYLKEFVATVAKNKVL